MFTKTIKSIVSDAEYIGETIYDAIPTAEKAADTVADVAIAAVSTAENISETMSEIVSDLGWFLKRNADLIVCVVPMAAVGIVGFTLNPMIPVVFVVVVSSTVMGFILMEIFMNRMDQPRLNYYPL